MMECRVDDKIKKASQFSRLDASMPLRKPDTDQLRSIPLFRDVSDGSMPILLKSASIQQFRTRTLLFTEGDQASSLYTVMQGSVELFSEHHERRSTIAVIRSRKPFLLTSMHEDNLNPFSACTLERSHLMVIPLKIMNELIKSDVLFARAMMVELVSEVRQLVEHCKNQRLRTTVERLAEWMLRADQAAGGTGQFVIPHDKRILASYLGMEAESLSRNLASLATMGVVVRGRHVSLSDRAALARLAGIEIAAPALGAFGDTENEFV